MHAVAARGRWIWVVSGLVTMAALLVPAGRLIATVGPVKHAGPQLVVVRMVTVGQPITSLNLQSRGAAVRITAGPAGRVQITETIAYNAPGGNLTVSAQPTSVDPEASAGSASGQPASGELAGEPPVVLPTLTDGQLSLSADACAAAHCRIGFVVTAPPNVTANVRTEGGAVIVSGIAGATVDSGGGRVWATKISGPLTVVNGGPVRISP